MVVEGEVTVAVGVGGIVGVTIGTPIVLKQNTTSAKSIRPLPLKSNCSTGSFPAIQVIWLKSMTTSAKSRRPLPLLPQEALCLVVDGEKEE